MKKISPQDRKKGVIAIIILAAIWGSMGIFSRYLNTNFTIFQQVYLRLFAAAGVGYIFFLKEINFKKISRLSLREWILIIIRAIFYYSIGVSLYSKSVIVTKLSNAVFIDSLPVAAVFGFFLFKEKVTVSKIFYTLLAFFGVVIIGVRNFRELFSWGVGETLMFISVWFTGLSVVLRKWQTNHLNNKEMTFLILLIGGVITLVFSFLWNEGIPTNWTTNMLIAVLLAGAANTAVIFLINYGFQKVDAVLGSNIITLQVLFAILVGLLFYGEIPLLKELIGGILIVLSVIQMNKLSNT